MEIKKIIYPTTLDKIEDIENDNIDIFVEFEDGMSYTMTVCTPKYYCSHMDRDELDYIPAGPPDIIVKKLTEESILRALKTYVEEEGYWLKVYYLAGSNESPFDLESMDKKIQAIQKLNDEIESDL